MQKEYETKSAMSSTRLENFSPLLVGEPSIAKDSLATVYSVMAINDRLIDDIDRDILAIIRKNARVSNVDIARKVGMAPSAILERIRKLESKGVIEGYETRLSPKALGLGLLAFVFVKAENDRVGESKTAQALVNIPEVLEVHHVAGEDCFLVKVRTADTESLGRLLREKFGKISTITSTRSTIVLNTMKETAQLPLEPSGNSRSS